MAVATISGAGTFGVSNALAQVGGDGEQSLIQELSQKLGIEESKVQSAFDQIHQEHKVKMQADYETRLNQLVSDGKITETQKQLILEKKKELESNRQSEMEKIKNMTPEERKSQMEAKRKELDDWAKQNGIDPEYLFLHGFGKEGGHKGFFMMKTPAPKS